MRGDVPHIRIRTGALSLTAKRGFGRYRALEIHPARKLRSAGCKTSEEGCDGRNKSLERFGARTLTPPLSCDYAGSLPQVSR